MRTTHHWQSGATSIATRRCMFSLHLMCVMHQVELYNPALGNAGCLAILNTYCHLTMLSSCCPPLCLGHLWVCWSAGPSTNCYSLSVTFLHCKKVVVCFLSCNQACSCLRALVRSIVRSLWSRSKVVSFFASAKSQCTVVSPPAPRRRGLPLP